jgi:coproporphyrinogen dehydrogenase HemZ
MIYLKMEGHTFLYYLENILRMFYKDEEIKLYEEEPPIDNRGIFVLSKLILENNIYKSEIEFKEEAIYLKSAVEIAVEEFEANKLELNKRLKKAMQRQLYKLLKEYLKKEMPWGILVGIRPTKIVSEMLSQNISKSEILDKLNSSYSVSKEKALLLYEVAKTEEELLAKTKSDMIGLYIGIPFCTTRCLYCSFTSNPIDKYKNVIESYILTLKREFAAVREIIEKRNFKVQSIYIGGGTPTSIDNIQLKQLLKIIEENINFKYLEEYTLEAGRPDSIGEEKLETIKASRVDRISINPQTMNDETLKLIGRKHSSEDIIKTFNLARSIGFENINMDIIAGLPGENLTKFENTLKGIRGLLPENLTIHTMSIKRASELRENKEKYRMTLAEEVSQMVDMGQQYAGQMGLHPYYLYRQKNILGNLENIGYCKSGFESVYNIQIMEEKQTILALGAGAVTKVVYPLENRIERAFNVKSVEEYLARVDEMVERKKSLLI